MAEEKDKTKKEAQDKADYREELNRPGKEIPYSVEADKENTPPEKGKYNSNLK